MFVAYLRGIETGEVEDGGVPAYLKFVAYLRGIETP